MMDGNGLSVADAIALERSGNGNCNDGFGDSNGWWVMFLFFLLAWGGNGWGGFGGGNNAGLQGALTRADLCQDMNFQSLENAVRGVNQGLCDGFYAMNTSLLNGFNGVNNTVQSGFAGVDNAICNLGYNIQQGFNNTNIAMLQGQNMIQSQLAQCCCENRAGQADIKYQMATDTCAIQNTLQNVARDIIDNNNANTRQLYDFAVNTKIEGLQNENNALRLAASQANQNATIGAMIDASTASIIRRTGNDCPVPAYVVPNPNCCYDNFYRNGYGYGNDCRCNNGCGC